MMFDEDEEMESDEYSFNSEDERMEDDFFYEPRVDTGLIPDWRAQPPPARRIASCVHPSCPLP